jgi:polyphosphate kinase
MDLKSYSLLRLRTRDEMFLATDTAWAPWYVVHSDDRRQARLKLLSHMLSKIPYEKNWLATSMTTVPARRHAGTVKTASQNFEQCLEAAGVTWADRVTPWRSSSRVRG